MFILLTSVLYTCRYELSLPPPFGFRPTFFLSCFICAGPFLLPVAGKKGERPESSIVGAVEPAEDEEEEKKKEEGREEKAKALACGEEEERRWKKI